jgi:hypothetical protein
MGYNPNLDDKNSPYYYGMDSTYKPASRKKTQQKRPAVASPLLANDPELQGYGLSQNPAAPAQPAKNNSVVRMGGKEYSMGDPKQKAAYETAQQAELTQQRGKSPMADIRGGNGQKADGSGRFSPPPAPNPNGVEQTGTQMGPRSMTMDEANSLLSGGYKVMNPFSNTQLPDTSGSPYFGQGKTPQYRSDVPEDTYDVQLSRNLTDGSPFNTDGYTYEVPQKTNIEFLQQDGSPKIALSGAKQTAQQVDPGNKTTESSIPKRPRGERAGEMWDRKYGRMDQSTSTSETKGSGIDYARRAAFLDAPNSLQGLRRVEAQKGIVYAGAQHHMVNPNAGQEGQNDFIAISKGDRDSYMRGDQGAQDLKSKYVKGISESSKTTAESAKKVSDAFQIDENQQPTSRIDATAQVNTQQITKAPELTQAVDVRFQDKDKSGRYNVFNNQ